MDLRKWLAGIHPKGSQDGCPITNVGHDSQTDSDQLESRCIEQRFKLAMGKVGKIATGSFEKGGA